ncbi:MAG TPA: energy transducer TonB [Stellaceae bacterium]|nr:energy transducer TonB [Stellaceae bacterium]
MSVATIGPGLADQDLVPGSAISDRMPGGIALSATLHVALLTVIALGLPNLFRPPVPQDTPIAVELVTIGPETRATHPNPHRPIPHAKPLPPQPAPPAPIPEPKPAPPQASAEPPPSAAPPPPPPTPQPPKEAPKPTPAPPPPPPPPKPMAAEKPPPPPPPLKPQPPRAEPKNPQPAFDTLMHKLDRPQPKPAPASFDSLLKNLTRTESAQTQDAPPQRQRVAATSPASSQPRAPLGSQLSASEIDVIREQIERCWNVPAGARDAKDLVVEIHVIMNPDGTVQQATIVNQGNMNDPYYRAAAESARRAFYNPQCTPLKLPPGKYDVWKDFVADFSPKDLL